MDRLDIAKERIALAICSAKGDQIVFKGFLEDYLILQVEHLSTDGGLYSQIYKVLIEEVQPGDFK